MVVILYRVTSAVGAVGCLRGVKRAAAVAQAIMKYTKHTMLVGNLGVKNIYQ